MIYEEMRRELDAEHARYHEQRKRAEAAEQENADLRALVKQLTEGGADEYEEQCAYTSKVADRCLLRRQERDAAIARAEAAEARVRALENCVGELEGLRCADGQENGLLHSNNVALYREVTDALTQRDAAQAELAALRASCADQIDACAAALSFEKSAYDAAQAELARLREGVGAFLTLMGKEPCTQANSWLYEQARALLTTPAKPDASPAADFDPFAPIEELPEHVRRDMASERGLAPRPVLPDASPSTEPARPEVGATVEWATARADMEAHPEAQWQPSHWRDSQYRVANGWFQFKPRHYGRWENSTPITEPRDEGDGLWLRLPDATPEPQAPAVEATLSERVARLEEAIDVLATHTFHTGSGWHVAAYNAVMAKLAAKGGA